MHIHRGQCAPALVRSVVADLAYSPNSELYLPKMTNAFGEMGMGAVAFSR